MSGHSALALAALISSLGCASLAAPQNEAVDLRVNLSAEPVHPAPNVRPPNTDRTTTRGYKVTVEIINSGSDALRLKKLSLRQTEAAQVVLPVIKRSYDLPVAAGAMEQVEFSAVAQFDNTSPGYRRIGPIRVLAEFSSPSGRFSRSQTISLR